MLKNQWEWKLSYVAAIAKYFHITIDYLVYGDLDEMYKDLVTAYNTLNLEMYNFHEEIEKLNTLKEIAIEKMTIHKPKLLPIVATKNLKKKSGRTKNSRG